MSRQTFHRGLHQMKVAAWTTENSYGTPYTVLGARQMSVEWVVETDELRGDDVVLDRYTRVISVTVNWAVASVDLGLLDILMGGTLTSTSGYEDFMMKETDEIPYVALAGKAVGSGGQGDLHIFVPKAKLSGNLAINAQEGNYIIPSATFQGVNEGTQNGMLRLRNFAAVTTLAIPLGTTSGA
jgi:hypothetical protein